MIQLVKGKKREAEIRLKVTDEELEQVKGLAKDLNMTLSNYVRYCITKVANEG